ncbi:MAG: carbonic anhydrase family protein [Burkholderiaceae bacterium]
MPAPSFHLPRAPAAWLLGLSLIAVTAPTLAADHAAAPAAKDAPKSVPAAVEPAPGHAATGDRAAAAEPSGARDPIAMLRERLANRLGANLATDPDSGEVRVVSKAAASTPTPPAHAAHSRRAAPRSAPEAATAAAHWDYAGSAGPESWGLMKPEFAGCASGTRQSPIDIRDGIKVDLETIRFDYKPSAFGVIDNGHTVQVNVAPGNSIEVTGRTYELVQFHFHRPSEERVNGKQFDMVAHLVHKDPQGRLAVVAVLLNRGVVQPVVQNVWNNLPLEKGEEVPARSLLNPNELLPGEQRYYTYMGSLTTPPCTEGVLWMVMKTPVPISTEQIGIFARLYPMNSRPIQAAQGRLIKESN